MRIGALFPQTESNEDPGAIRDFTQAVEDLGYSHIVAFDHVLGAHPDRPGGWTGFYTHESTFHEIFILFTYIAAVTERVGLVPGVLVLPQRQTALVAKQAASLDVLSGGRVRVGAGIGWNAVEYEALGEDFHNRGKRMEEQVDVLRKLWTEPVVDYAGKWHRIGKAGIKPLPVQRPIPVWFGGSAEPVLERIARLADGWFPQFRSIEEAPPVLERLWDYARKAGRNPESIGIEGRLGVPQTPPEEWGKAVEGWRALGASHLLASTLRGDLSWPEGHIEMYRRFKDEVGSLS